MKQHGEQSLGSTAYRRAERANRKDGLFDKNRELFQKDKDLLERFNSCFDLLEMILFDRDQTLRAEVNSDDLTDFNY